MNKKDGEKIFKVIEEWINIELQAGNRVTKNNGNFLGGMITQIVSQIINNDINKEKLWDEFGKEWIEENNKKEEENKKKVETEELKEKFMQMKKEFDKKQSTGKTVKKEGIIDISKPLNSNLLDEKLKR